MLVLLVAFALADQPSKPVDWKAMISGIRDVLKNDPGSQGSVEEHYGIGIRNIADITGDGITEALVYLGTGGASTDALTLMRIENDKPVPAMFTGRDGKPSSVGFLRGASVMHTDDVEMLPLEHAIYSIHYSFSGTHANGVQKVRECGGEAYKWNPQTKTFDHNRRLSDRLNRDYCKKVREKWR